MIAADDELVVRPEPFIADRVPAYIERWRRDCAVMAAAIDGGDFELAARLGHTLKGSGGGYGMMRLSELGAELERAAHVHDAERAQGAVGGIRDYLARVRVETSPPAPVARSAAAPRKVVIVDDDPDLCDLLDEVLSRDGYHVHVVPNGLKLVGVLAVDKPDLILLDVTMSWINGFDLCKAIKANADYAHIPVVFVSARGTPADIEHGRRNGAADYLVKPIDLTDMKTRLDRILGQR